MWDCAGISYWFWWFEIAWSVCLSNGSISFGATKVTDITESSGKLFCHGKLIDGVEMNVGLNRFGLCLKEFWGSVVLVGHNTWAFDVKHFWNNVKKMALGGFVLL